MITLTMERLDHAVVLKLPTEHAERRKEKGLLQVQNSAEIDA